MPTDIVSRVNYLYGAQYSQASIGLIFGEIYVGLNWSKMRIL